MLVTPPTFFFIALLAFLLAGPAMLRAQGGRDTTRILSEQEKDAAIKKARHKAIYGDARKATIMSACLPGLGQIHNKRYWKLPIIYAAIGGLTWWGVTSHNNYKYYSNNLKAEFDNDASTSNQTPYSTDNLIILKNTEKKYRDYAIIGVAVIYLLNVVDANVDAHLKTFDVSDDLSLHIDPYSNIGYNRQLNTGLTLRLTFK